jgi:beta-phosphoglucomutase family hydrolase
MTTASRRTVTIDGFDAVLFDLDGVLTSTARVHSACWKKMFDEFLQGYSAEKGEPFEPFDINADYRLYVDGKPRYDGVQSFLGSRGIELPQGSPDDAPEEWTVCGLGNHKDELFNEMVRSEGVEPYKGSIDWVHSLRSHGIQTAVVSSSKNCRVILQAAGIEDLFDTRVDGEVAARLSIPGKPAPDTFLEAAKQLAVKPGRAVVVEDAIPGVQAGHAGGFGLVIGVDRHDDADALLDNGADIVVKDLSEMLEE